MLVRVVAPTPALPSPLSATSLPGVSSRSATNFLLGVSQVVPWMHENRWQKRTGAWTRKVPDGDAGGTHSFGAGQGCRKDSVPEGFRLPLYNGPESPEPSANRAFRPPTWGRAGDTSVPMASSQLIACPCPRNHSNARYDDGSVWVYLSMPMRSSFHQRRGCCLAAATFLDEIAIESRMSFPLAPTLSLTCESQVLEQCKALPDWNAGRLRRDDIGQDR